MSTRDELLERFVNERPLYTAFCEEIVGRLKAEARRRALPMAVTARAKEVASFGKKLVIKGYDQYHQVKDKAGARLVVDGLAQVPSSEELVNSLFDVKDREDKAEHLDPRIFDYQGLHLEAVLCDAGEFDGLVCEIQIHTRAQNMWSDATHDVLYKTVRPETRSVRRTLHRLNAFVETFDLDLARVREESIKREGYEHALILTEFERQFFRLTASRNYNPELSLAILDALRPLLEDQPRDMVARRLVEFVDANESKLRETYAYYAEDYRHLLLFQPETLLLFELLETQPFELRQAWNEALDPELLTSVADAWGVDV